MPKKKPLKEKVDKRYRAKVTVGHDADGKPIIKYASGRTKRELEENKVELRRHHVDGAEVVRRDVMFNQYSLEWYEVFKQPMIGVSSQRVYDGIFANHIFPAFKDRQLKSIRQADLQRFLNDRAHMGRTTVNYIKTILRNTFQRAMIDGIISRDPTLGLMYNHAPEKGRRALTDNEEAAALHVIDTHPEGLFLAVLYYTGMRRGEALGLKWDDIDFRSQEVSVQRDIDYVTNEEGELKTFCSNRTIPIPDPLFVALQASRGIGATYVFQSPRGASYMSEDEYKAMWARLAQAMYEFDKTIEHRETKYSIDNRKRQESRIRLAEKNNKTYDVRKEAVPQYASILTAHYFRHNFASLCYNSGIDVMTSHKWLGHADPTTTLSIYTHLSRAKEETNAEAMNKAFSKKVARRLPDAKTILNSKNAKN